MEFEILDTERAYRRLLDAPDAAAREVIFRAELAEPFAGVAQVFGMSDPVAAFAMWQMKPEQLGPDNREQMRGVIDALAGADAWKRAARALARGRDAFAAYADHIPLERIVFGLLLADMGAMPQAGGYTGFGGIPGWIMTVYGEASADNLARVEAATVHELHHNVMGVLPWESNGGQRGYNIMTTFTVGDYMILEGLAESFAAELYGADKIGPWILDFDTSKLEATRAAFKAALDLTGFNTLRSYIFGDGIIQSQGSQAVGVPDYAGYAMGYFVVQEYLKRTGKRVAEATFVPAREIIAESGVFG